MNKKKTAMVGAIATIGIATAFFMTNDLFYFQKIKLERISKRIFYYAQDQVAQVTEWEKTDVFQIPIPFHPQEHALTCETAALRMALNYYGENVTEDELLEKLSFSTRGPKTNDNIWGDPDLGFVGNIDGSVFKGTGYGVYEEPIKNLAVEYRTSFIVEKADLSEILEKVKSGHPVIVWGLLSRRKPIVWKTGEGKIIEAQPGEHARVVAGFYGTVSNPTKIILMDPIYGKIRMSKEKFLSDWKVMKNRAVAVH